MWHSTIRRLFALSLLATGSILKAEPGVTQTEITLGQTAAFDGPTKALGLGMRTGLTIFFEKLNHEGGIRGRKITLLSRDDGYEPERAAANARALIEKDNVFLLIGGVGTPTASEIVPICAAAHVPFVAPFTGGGALRKPFNPYVVNLRASYAQEIEVLVHYLVDVKKLSKIACLSQDDLYGQSGFKSLTIALKKRGLDLVASGIYVRNTTAVGAAALAIRKESPEAVVMVGTYAACGEFVRLSRKAGADKTQYCSISFVGTRALMATMGAEAEGMVITQVMPNPLDSDLAVVKEYLAALKAYAPDSEPDWISLEGFVAGKLFAVAVERAGEKLTRESFLAALFSGAPIDLGGLQAVFGPDDNQALDSVYLTKVAGGKVVSFD